MSIINRSRRFIFVHVPKSAGTTVTETLSAYTEMGDVEIGGTDFGEKLALVYGPRFGVWKHSTATEIRSILNASQWNDSFKFGFVRNPYARAFSIYRFLKFAFRDWPGSEIMDSFENYSDFVYSDFFTTEGPDRILLPQAFWICESLSDPTVALDFVGRVESINIDLPAAVRMFDSSFVASEHEVPRLNVSSDAFRWKDAHSTNKIIERVSARYAVDFQTFGYCPEIA